MFARPGTPHARIWRWRAEGLRNLADHLLDALRVGDVGLDEQVHPLTFRQRRTCSGRHGRATRSEASSIHEEISRRAIFSPSRVKA
jgi:hypothetical protein